MKIDCVVTDVINMLHEGAAVLRTFAGEYRGEGCFRPAGAIMKLVLKAFARRLEHCVTPNVEATRRIELWEEAARTSGWLEVLESDVAHNLAEMRTWVELEKQCVVVPDASCGRSVAPPVVDGVKEALALSPE